MAHDDPFQEKLEKTLREVCEEEAVGAFAFVLGDDGKMRFIFFLDQENLEKAEALHALAHVARSAMIAINKGIRIGRTQAGTPPPPTLVAAVESASGISLEDPDDEDLS